MSRRWRAAASLALCLLAVMVLRAASEGADAEVRYYDGAAGAWVRGDHVDVRVQRVQLTQRVEPAYGEAAETEDAFVVVDYSVSVRDRRASLDRLTAVTRDGLRYDNRSEVDSLSAAPPTEAGFTSHGTAVFEVPRDRLAGLDFVVGPDSALFVAYSGAVRVTDVVGAGTPTVTSVALAEASTEVTP